MENVSILKALDLPPAFGALVLIFSFILFVAPYVEGDFGIVKIPAFPQRLRRRLAIIGPICFACAVIVHIPFVRRAVAAAPSSTIQSSNRDETQPHPESQGQHPASKITRSAQTPSRKLLSRSTGAIPADPLQTQLAKYLVELDTIERDWENRHTGVEPLAERVAAVLKARYPESARNITAASSLPDSKSVAAAIRLEIQKVSEQMDVNRVPTNSHRQENGH